MMMRKMKGMKVAKMNKMETAVKITKRKRVRKRRRYLLKVVEYSRIARKKIMMMMIKVKK